MLPEFNSTNGDATHAAFVVREGGAEKGPCVVSATSVVWRGISSIGVR